MRIFALGTQRDFAEKVAASLGVPLDPLEERSFEDGEHKIRPLVNVRNRDVYVIQSLYADGGQSVNDKLCKLLFFIATLKDAGADRVTAITPYLCYTRKDRRTKARDPVTIRYMASLFEAVNLDRIVTIDVHNLQAFQNAFRIPAEHLEAEILFVRYFHELLKDTKSIVVMSPDIGGVKRAQQFQQRLARVMSTDIDFAFMEKQRSKDVLSGEMVIGDVKGKTVIIIDDLISSGSTLARAASACERMGASQCFAVVTHGMFSGKADAVLSDTALHQIVVTNTIPPFRLEGGASREKLAIVDVAPLFADVINRLHSGGSIVELMDKE
jgi:ribose-phosphate pyrophosphokinase